MTYVQTVILVSLIVVIIFRSIFGVATNAIIRNKGYYENWFWWGFFFGFIAMMVAMSKQPRYDSNAEFHYVKMLMYSIYNNENPKITLNGTSDPNTWRCACGYTNPNYLKRCACGRKRPKQWICQCGISNADYVETCVCGRTKKENGIIN